MIKCKVCKYWDKHAATIIGSHYYGGFCRVLPPVIEDLLLKAVWPVSLETDSCGAGEPRTNLK